MFFYCPPLLLQGILVGNKNTLPTLQEWWATKTRYPPYIEEAKIY